MSEIHVKIVSPMYSLYKGNQNTFVGHITMKDGIASLSPYGLSLSEVEDIVSYMKVAEMNDRDKRK